MANIELDGANKKIKVDSGDLTLDVPGDIILDADGADLVFADGGTNILKVTNSSSDVVFQPQVDAKDIIFKQYDGTTVATVEDNGTFNIPTDKLAINGTAVTSTAAELNILDGVTSTASELNILDGVTSTASELNILDGVTATASEINLLDGGTSVGGSITLADADGFIVNDGGTMKTIPASDISTYAGGTHVQTGSTTGTGSSVSISNCFSSTYDFYVIHFYFHFANNGSALRFRILDSGGERSESQYQYSSRMFESNASGGSHTGESADYIEIINSGSQGYDDGGVHGILHVHLNNGHGTASHSNTFSMAGFYKSSPDNSVNRVRAYYHASNYIDTITNHEATGFKFFASSGNLEITNVKVYGLKGSGT